MRDFMKRVNGFLCIDNYKRKESDYWCQYWVYINGEEYYFKPTDDFYVELMGYHIAKFLGIDACYTDLAILRGEKGIISKSLRKKGVDLVSGTDILKQYLEAFEDDVSDMGYKVQKYKGDFKKAMTINSLEMIWQPLEFKYKDKANIEEIMHQIVKMYFLDIILNNWDRHGENWMIEERTNDIKLAPLFDWDNALKKDFLRFEMGTSVTDLSTDKFGERAFQKMFYNFFNTSASEYFDMFINMFNEVNNNFYNIIRLAEKQINSKIPIKFKLQLLLNFYKIKKCINEMIKVQETKRQR